MLSREILFLDLGSSALKAIVLNQKKFTITYKTTFPNAGISNGYISNGEVFSQSVNILVKQIEKKIKKKLHYTVLILGGKILKYKVINSAAIAVNKIIDGAVMSQIDNIINDWAKQNNNVAISSIGIEYKIDDAIITNPIGLYANTLHFSHIVAYANSNQLGCILYTLEKMQLDIIEILPSIYCCAELHLTKDERELGSLIFDIGASSINWGYFYKNKPINAGSIDYGSSEFTYKLAKGLKIAITEADRLKCEHSGAILTPQNFCQWAEFIKDSNTEYILESELSRKIMPEVEAMSCQIGKIIQHFSRNAHLAMLCGHGAWLKNLDTVIQKNTNSTIKLSPSASPEYDALNGAVMIYQNQQKDLKIKKINLFSRLLFWIKNNL